MLPEGLFKIYLAKVTSIIFEWTRGRADRQAGRLAGWQAGRQERAVMPSLPAALLACLRACVLGRLCLRRLVPVPVQVACLALC